MAVSSITEIGRALELVCARPDMTRVEIEKLCTEARAQNCPGVCVIGARVDGLSAGGSAVVEIKCGNSVYRKTSASGRVPDYYYGQLQHALAVTGLTSIDFWCYLPNCPEVLVTVDRNDDYIKRLLEAEYNFWQQVLKRTS